MDLRRVLLCLSITLLPASAGTAPKSGTTVPVEYEGGTLPLSQGKTKATISEDKVVFSNGHHIVAVPFEHITTISCSTEVRRRFGAPVLGWVPKLHWSTAEDHYVGLTLAGSGRDGQPAGRAEMVLKLNGAEYSEFVSALERGTGRKAVDSRSVPTVVRYGL